jgi:EpsI family protein
MKSHIRFAVVFFLLLATGLFLHARGEGERIPVREPLTSFPSDLGPWKGTNVAISPDVLEVLGAGDFLFRVYQNSVSPEPYVDMFIAYFPSQRTGDTLHSPKNCLPGAGWSPVESERISVALPGRAPFPANRYLVARGSDRVVVVYWYWAHNRGVASEYWAKFYLVADSIRLNRSDGSLFRLTTPLKPGESLGAAQARILSFAGDFSPLMDAYIPR